MSIIGVPPESPDPEIRDASFISEIADVATVAERARARRRSPSRTCR